MFCYGKRKIRKGAGSVRPVFWTPTPHGQAESERLVAGDTRAISDLTTLITRTGLTSARVPHLNSSGLVATSELLHSGNDDAMARLTHDQAAAQRRSQGTRPWRSLFFSNASLIGENFQQAFLDIYGDSKASSVENDEGKPSHNSECQGHWQLVFCSGQNCSVQHYHPDGRPPVGKVPVQAAQRVSLTESLQKELDEEEFSFDTHLRDQAEYEQALCRVIAVAARPGSAKVVSVAALEQAGTLEERWSTLAQTGCPEAPTESPHSIRLSLIGPPSGPPSVALPPNPPSSAACWPLRSGK